MQKLMSNKKGIIGICAAAVVIVAAVVILLSTNKEEAYRSILVYEIEGSAVIERAAVGSMNAAENLYLESGDRVSVAQDSSMRLKLDDDKYVMAEADTIFSVEAEGEAENSKTKIRLEQGAVTNEIQHPLSDGASYETSTPNSVMAVRGTIYRVELYTDENGEQNTKMCCFQGKVETTPILPDGTSGEPVLVPAGSETTVHSDGTADDVRDIVYEELPEQAIENLRSMLESGQTMEGITLEELDNFIDQTSDTGEASENNESEQTVLAETEERFGQKDAVIDTDTDTDVAENVSAQAEITVKVPAMPQAQDNIRPKAPETTSAGGSDNKNTAADNSQGGNNSNGSVNDNDQNNGGSNDDGSNDDGSDKEEPDKESPEKPSTEATYTVTFEYQGTTFATQKVKSGEKASAPLLAPAESGAWDFDFGTEIKANTTVKWK